LYICSLKYNLNLSIQFEDCIDKFIAHSKYIFEQLSIKIPHRLNDIQLIHYGIPIKEKVSRNINIDNNLNLLFLGRHVKDKGIFDIYEINKILKEKNGFGFLMQKILV
jgi:glycosyltransferase involved in cell wall biosynthesis